MSRSADNPNAVAPPGKREQVLAAARLVFGELGYERASVDLIAARAGVSKATIYSHFGDKQSLFVAAVVAECEALRSGLAPCREPPAGDVEEGLVRLGERIMTIFLTPAIRRLFRQATAESERLPEIGRLVFERGTSAVLEAIAHQLQRLAERGALRIPDPREAAIDFFALCQGDLTVRARLGVLEYPVDEKIRETVRRAVRTFVRAHRA
ncbi:MAG TPA: TetR/AcrR family transcriptional regulator [Anaeromyxobacter sp.]